MTSAEGKHWEGGGPHNEKSLSVLVANPLDIKRSLRPSAKLMPSLLPVIASEYDSRDWIMDSTEWTTSASGGDMHIDRGVGSMMAGEIDVNELPDSPLKRKHDLHTLRSASSSFKRSPLGTRTSPSEVDVTPVPAASSVLPNLRVPTRQQPYNPLDSLAAPLEDPCDDNIDDHLVQ